MAPTPQTHQQLRDAIEVMRDIRKKREEAIEGFREYAERRIGTPPPPQWAFELELADRGLDELHQDTGLSTWVSAVNEGSELDDHAMQTLCLQFSDERRHLRALTQQAQIIQQESESQTTETVAKFRTKLERDPRSFEER